MITGLQLNTPTYAESSDGSLTIKVVRDVNQNGTYEPVLEFGMTGVQIRITDANGVTSTRDTNGNGDLFIPAGDPILAGGKYRVEAINPNPSIFKPANAAASGTPSATNISSNVEFVDLSGGNNKTITFGYSNPADYCQANPMVFSACQAAAPSSQANATMPVEAPPYLFYKADYRGGNADELKGSTQTEVGNVYGFGYDRQTGDVYAAANAKRATTYGTLGGPGSIYKVDKNTGAATLWATVPDVGSTTHNWSALEDYEFRKVVGKESLGDLDVSDDGKTLYVVNLNNRNLYAFNTTDGSILYNTPIPNQCVNASDWRPFGLGEHDGMMYVGGVCSGENTPAELSAKVITFDPIAQTFGSVILDQPLNYTRDDNTISNCKNANWKPWTDTIPITCIADSGFANQVTWPTPVLSDISFKNDGTMMVAMRDRSASQYGNGVLAEQAFFGVSARPMVVPGGDLLKACPVNGSFVFDENGGCGLNNEFFHDTRGISFGNPLHQEGLYGGMAYTPSETGVVVNSVDPLDAPFQSGLSNNSTVNGSWTSGTLVNDTYRKSEGLADIEVLCDLAPIQIGNRVWLDSNGNGIQDPEETVIPNVTVQLKDENGNVLNTTTTNTNGEYYFDNVNANTKYYVVLGNPADYAVGGPLHGYVLTNQDVDSNGNDKLDSDAGLNSDSNAEIVLTTGNAGENNHTYDFGFAPERRPDLALRKALSDGQSSTVRIGDTVNWTIMVYNQGNVTARDITITDALPTGVVLDDSTWSQSGANIVKVLNDVNLQPDGHVEVTLKTKVTSDAVEGDLVNTAEISNVVKTDGSPFVDVDSTADSDLTNDVLVDDVIDSTPTGNPADEDDHDIATVTLEKVGDLALQKKLATGQSSTVKKNDTVNWTVTVFNQGQKDAKNIVVSDLLPDGFVMDDSSWTVDPNNSKLFTKAIIETLKPTDSFVLTMKTKYVGNDPTGTKLINNAEISSAENADGSVFVDVDSTPDSDMTNDGVVDDVIDSTPTGNPADEDDHDIALVDVVMDAPPVDNNPQPNNPPTTTNPGAPTVDNSIPPLVKKPKHRRPTALPHTGAPFGSGMIGLAGALIVGGAAMLVCTRRKN